MITSIAVCIAAFFWLLFLIRHDELSLGLPVAYLFSLLLIHVPGAYVHAVTDYLKYTEYVEYGIRYTAFGAVSFVAGVWSVRFFVSQRQPLAVIDNHKFPLFCLFGGWFFTYAMIPLHAIPSLGAAVEKAGTIWMLGVMLGLTAAVRRGNLASIGAWLLALMIYPVLMLLLGGFLSYGATAAIVVLCALTVSVRSYWKVIVGIVVAIFLGINLFVNYFAHRDEIRAEVWGGAPLADRIDATLDVVRDFQWFDSENRKQARALDERLNQNYFAGLAGARIQQGLVNYLYGRSLWEGAIALVPRLLWPDKPVLAGSPKIVSEMTGLVLNQNTSWGVGNVMEFQINFGIPGLIGGFFVLGVLLSYLDKSAALAVRQGNFGRAIMHFLPAIALIQPNGSIVEMSSGAVAALIGALGWRWAWQRWFARTPLRRISHRADAPSPW